MNCFLCNNNVNIDEKKLELPCGCVLHSRCMFVHSYMTDDFYDIFGTLAYAQCPYCRTGLFNENVTEVNIHDENDTTRNMTYDTKEFKKDIKISKKAFKEFLKEDKQLRKWCLNKRKEVLMAITPSIEMIQHVYNSAVQELKQQNEYKQRINIRRKLAKNFRLMERKYNITKYDLWGDKIISYKHYRAIIDRIGVKYEVRNLLRLRSFIYKFYRDW